MTQNLDDLTRELARCKQRIQILENLAMIDEVTGLLNRAGFESAFAREIGRIERNVDSGGLLILIDIDNFRTINDLYGAQAGDNGLRLVAKTLMRDCRPMDTCARLSGDEFVLLLSGATRDVALTRAQDIIRRLNGLSLIWYGAEIPLRASLALKDYRAGDNMDHILNTPMKLVADDAISATFGRKKGIAAHEGY